MCKGVSLCLFSLGSMFTFTDFHAIFSEGKSAWIPFDLGPYCSTSGFDAASVVFHEISSGLQSVGVVLEQV